MNYEQKQQFEQLTKLKIDYTLEIQTCINCMHSAHDDYHLYCMVNNLCNFKTEEHASCRKFSKKINEDGTTNSSAGTQGT